MLDLLLVLVAVLVALLLRPWRSLGAAGPPWPWLFWAALMPWAWSSDRLVSSAVLQPLSGASLLVLMAGWPLAVLGMLPITLLALWLGQLDAWEAVHRLVWLGLVPATLAMLAGAGVRRYLPHHLFVYILARGFVVTLLATALAGLLATLLQQSPGALAPAELLVARWLAAWGDAVLSGMLVAIFVAFRPQWLATYSDHIYLDPLQK
jgi:uncharacterized membrane protein